MIDLTGDVTPQSAPTVSTFSPITPVKPPTPPDDPGQQQVEPEQPRDEPLEAQPKTPAKLSPGDAWMGAAQSGICHWSFSVGKQENWRIAVLMLFVGSSITGNLFDIRGSLTCQKAARLSGACLETGDIALATLPLRHGSREKDAG